MIGVSNFFIIGIIKDVVVTLFKIIYKILCFFNLQITLFCAVVGVLLYITGFMKQGDEVFLIFSFAVILSVVYAIFATIRKAFKITEKEKPKGHTVQTVTVQERAEQKPQSIRSEKPIQTESQRQSENLPISRAVKYFSVKQNPNYVMAEYDDRYELYLKTANGLKYVRTDRK